MRQYLSAAIVVSLSLLLLAVRADVAAAILIGSFLVVAWPLLTRGR